MSKFYEHMLALWDQYILEVRGKDWLNNINQKMHKNKKRAKHKKKELRKQALKTENQPRLF